MPWFNSSLQSLNTPTLSPTLRDGAISPMESLPPTASKASISAGHTHVTEFSEKTKNNIYFDKYPTNYLDVPSTH
jgi:hypothetical protein